MSSRRLVEAAAALIVEKGWEATTAAEIGRRAGYSRAMVHARYGSKDAILDAFFLHEYVRDLSPAPDPTATGLAEAVGHFDRVRHLFAEDSEFLRAMFVATFEAVKSTSPLRPRVQAWLKRGIDKAVDAVVAGLKTRARKVTRNDEIVQVGTISANSDTTIGDNAAGNKMCDASLVQHPLQSGHVER